MTTPKLIKGLNGETYDSIAELAKAYGLKYEMLKYRLSRGMTLEDILANKTSRTIKDPDGNEYPTFGAMCEAYGIMEQTVRARLRNGDDLKTALTTETSTRHKRDQGVQDHLGNKFKTFGDMCEYYKQSRNSVKKRLKDGMDLKSALETPSQKHRYTDHLGNEFPSLSAMCAHYGTKIQTVKSRMERQGMSLEQALTGEGLVTSCRDHLGNVYPSFKAMCRAYNIDDQTARQRIEMKWPLEKALTTSTTTPSPNTLVPCKDYLGRSFISFKAMQNYYMVGQTQINKYKSPSTKGICDSFKGRIIIINGHRFKITKSIAPYLRIEIDDEEYIMHFEKMLEMYHDSNEFDATVGLRHLRNQISSIKPIKFPYYDIVIDGVSKKISYWDLMRGDMNGKEEEETCASP